MCSLIRGLFKIVMFLINLFVFLCGVALIVIGAVLMAKDEWGWLEDIVGSDTFNPDAVYTVGIILICTGSLLFLTGFFGCCGIIKENSCMLWIYIIVVSLLLVLTITAGILAAVYKDDLNSEARTEMQRSINETYGVDLDKTTSWDNLQIQLKCCAAVNYLDYATSFWFNIPGNNYTVPKSCCRGAEFKDGMLDLDQETYNKCSDADESILYKKGCYSTMADWIDDASKIILGVVFAIAGVQLLGVIVACCIVKNKSDDNYA